jgi:hypothetical protein
MVYFFQAASAAQKIISEAGKMNNIKDLREELMRRKAAQPAPEPRKSTTRNVILASLTLCVLVAVAAVTLL